VRRLKRSLRRNWRKDAVTGPSIDTWRSCVRFFDAACATGNGSTREPTRPNRFLTQTQALTLLKELPPHLRELATFGLATGLRAANITGLVWDQVDIARRLAWIHPDQAKARKAIAVPLNDMAMGVLGRCAGAHSEYVFVYQEKPIKQVSTKAWHRACKRAGITDFSFHDLRHTWASWHIQHGTPLFALQELGGWETERMVRRYAHLSADHLAVYVGNSEIHGTFTAHQPDQLKLLNEKVLENP
jgi:integrase